MKLTLPLAVYLPRKRTADKRWALNLNVYRNAQFFALNSSKQIFHDLVAEQLLLVPHDEKKLTPPVLCKYTLYPGSKRLTDLGNVLSIVQKYTEDALVHSGVLPDDNYLVIPRVIHCFGEVDKGDPRVVFEMEELR